MYIRRNNLQQSKNHALEQHLVIQDNAYFDLLSEMLQSSTATGCCQLEEITNICMNMYRKETNTPQILITLNI